MSAPGGGWDHGHAWVSAVVVVLFLLRVLWICRRNRKRI